MDSTEQGIRFSSKPSLSTARRKNIALAAAAKKETITELSKIHGVCRKTVRQARDRALKAVDNSFDKEHKSVLFHLPVTPSWIEQFVLSLILVTRASYREIKTLLKDLFNTSISIGTIHNIYASSAKTAHTINQQEKLNGITVACHDELFHHNKPVLTGIDSSSLYCYLLSREDQRDEETWSIHLLDSMANGLQPHVMVSDEGSGLLAAHKSVFPDVRHYYDNFHFVTTTERSKAILSKPITLKYNR